MERAWNGTRERRGGGREPASQLESSTTPFRVVIEVVFSFLLLIEQVVYKNIPPLHNGWCFYEASDRRHQSTKSVRPVTGPHRIHLEYTVSLFLSAAQISLVVIRVESQHHHRTMIIVLTQRNQLALVPSRDPPVLALVHLYHQAEKL